MASGEHGAILPDMTLRRGDVADAAVAVLVVVPMYEAHRPLPGGVQIGEPLEWELRPIALPASLFINGLAKKWRNGGNGTLAPTSALMRRCTVSPNRIADLLDCRKREGRVAEHQKPRSHATEGYRKDETNGRMLPAEVARPMARRAGNTRQLKGHCVGLAASAGFDN